MSKADGPRIILLDIETLPNVVTSWGLKVDGWLGHENIQKERSVVCVAWKDLGEKAPTHTVSVLSRPGKKGLPDYGVIRKLHDVLSNCDGVIAHNGDNFDLKWLRTRMAIAGFQPTPPVTTIDTLKIARGKFLFNSNRLDYLGRVLKLGNKIKTDYDLWKSCMSEDREAIRKMVEYNKHDVRLLERVYLRLRPYVPARLNAALWGTHEFTCPTCGEPDLISRGVTRTLSTVWHRYQCQGCGAWSKRPPSSKVIR